MTSAPQPLRLWLLRSRRDWTARALLGRPISDDEIEPRNAAYRRSGMALGAAAYLQSRAWFGMLARRMADWWNDPDMEWAAPTNTRVTRPPTGPQTVRQLIRLRHAKH